MKVGGSRLPPRAEPAGGGWPLCPCPLCSRLSASPAKKGPLEDKDDISKLVTGLMKTSICRQISYKTVEGNEVRAAPSPCAPLLEAAHGTVLTSCPPQATPGSCRSTGSSPVETLVEETSHKSVSPSIRGTMASSCEGEQCLSRPPHLPRASCPAPADSGAG